MVIDFYQFRIPTITAISITHFINLGHLEILWSKNSQNRGDFSDLGY